MVYLGEESSEAPTLQDLLQIASKISLSEVGSSPDSKTQRSKPEKEQQQVAGKFDSGSLIHTVAAARNFVVDSRIEPFVESLKDSKGNVEKVATLTKQEISRKRSHRSESNSSEESNCVNSFKKALRPTRRSPPPPCQSQLQVVPPVAQMSGTTSIVSTTKSMNEHKVVGYTQQQQDKSKVKEIEVALLIANGDVDERFESDWIGRQVNGFPSPSSSSSSSTKSQPGNSRCNYLRLCFVIPIN